MQSIVHPRNRITNASTPLGDNTTTVVTKYPTETVVTTTRSPAVAPNSEQKTMGDTVNKGWRKKQRAGIVTMSDMTIVKSSRNIGAKSRLVCTARWSGYDKNNGQPCTIERVTTMDSDFISTGFESNINTLWIGAYDLEQDMGALANLAIAKAMAKVQASDLMVGEFAADFAKTAMMFKDPFGSASKLLAKILRAKKKRMLKSGSNAVQAAATAWLESQYGWQPIFIDMDKCVEAVASAARFGGGGRGGNHRVARAEVRRDSEIMLPFSFGSTTDPIWNRAGTSIRKQTGRACSGVIYGINNRNDPSKLLAFLGLRLNDVPSTILEIIPMSFVAGWFANIGDWLRAITPDPEIQIHGSWTTSMYKRTTTTVGMFNYSEYVTPTGPYAKACAALSPLVKEDEWVQRIISPPVAATPTLTTNWESVRHTLSGLSLSALGISAGVRKLGH